MRFVEATESVEILNDTSEADALRRARGRQELIMQPTAEEAIHCFDPAGARGNKMPARHKEDT